MKYFAWDPDKNEELKATRDISFENIIEAIIEGRLISIIPHPNRKRYPSQKIILVEIHDYIYATPFVEDQQKVFLKTIYPSRKHTRDHIEKGGRKYANE